MRSNKLSAYFGFTTFGESHGPAMGIVIEDVKPNLDFPFDQLNHLLATRKPSSTQYASSRQETDDYQIISGVFEGKTTGMPVCILFWNKDAQSADYEFLKDVFRPGHADFGWFNKFKIYDYRGGGRASGRETISRVAASAFIDEIIQPVKVTFQTVQVGKLKAPETDNFQFINADNPFCWAVPDQLSELYSYLDKIKAEHDTVGGLVQVRINNVPTGLGDPVFEKLNANLAKAIFSIGSVKGVSFGDGFDLTSLKGSEANDQMDVSGFLSNYSGGINGGISTGQPILINIAIKPVSSHGKAQLTINKNNKPVNLQITGRHDVCHITRILPVIEAMIKLTLADAISWQNQISGKNSSLNDYREMLDKLDEDLLLLLFRRKSVVKLVREYKAENKLEFRDPDREKSMLNSWIETGHELGFNQKDTTELFKFILEICRHDNSLNSL